MSSAPSGLRTGQTVVALLTGTIMRTYDGGDYRYSVVKLNTGETSLEHTVVVIANELLTPLEEN